MRRGDKAGIMEWWGGREKAHGAREKMISECELKSKESALRQAQGLAGVRGHKLISNFEMRISNLKASSRKTALRQDLSTRLVEALESCRSGRVEARPTS